MQRLSIHLEHPQARHVSRAVAAFRQGGVNIYPTDTAYGLGCDLYAKQSIERVRDIKGIDSHHPLSFMCMDLSAVAHYAMVSNAAYRILRRYTPGPYTFILPATREVPKLVQSKAKTVGVRLPSSPVCAALLAELGHPLITTTVSCKQAGGVDYFNDPDDMAKVFAHQIDVLLDGGPLNQPPSSIIDLTGAQPKLLRRGAGDVDWVEKTAL